MIFGLGGEDCVAFICSEVIDHAIKTKAGIVSSIEHPADRIPFGGKSCQDCMGQTS